MPFIKGSTARSRLWAGSFGTNGSSSPSATQSGTSPYAVVTRTATGTYNLNLVGGTIVTAAGVAEQNYSSGAANAVYAKVKGISHTGNDVTIVTYSGTAAHDYAAGELTVSYWAIGK